MTYTLTLTPYLAAQLSACCLHSGLDIANLFPAWLTRHSEPPTTTAATAGVEEPAVLNALGLPATPAPEPELPVLEFDPAALRLH